MPNMAAKAAALEAKRDAARAAIWRIEVQDLPALSLGEQRRMSDFQTAEFPAPLSALAPGLGEVMC